MRPLAEIEAVLFEAGMKPSSYSKHHRAVLKGLGDLVHDSGRAGPNNAFIAVEGLQTDGHRYIGEVLQKGCSLVFANKTHSPPKAHEDKFIFVNDTKKLVQRLGAPFYSHPSKDCRLVGITGSNGKTSTASFVERLLMDEGEVVGVLGTIGHRLNGELVEEAKNTTPNNLDVHRLLRLMVERKASTIVVEVSSHGLVEKRVDNLHFDTCVFTNISREHLDFHPTMEAYLKAKLSLFSLLDQSEKVRKKGVVGLFQPVLNSPTALVDCFHSKAFSYSVCYFAEGRQLSRLAQKLPSSVIEFLYGYSWVPSTEEFGRARYSLRKGTTCLTSFEAKLLGSFNGENITAALLATCDFVRAKAKPSPNPNVFDAATIPGRMEVVVDGLGRRIVVDYAHTPEALKAVLLALREAKGDRVGRLLCLFGCGGNRDSGKRQLMGEVASRYADFVVLTSDNPRDEDPTKIIEAIMEGVLASEQQPKVQVVADRKEAINKAVEQMEDGDVLVLAGKGHEATQTIRGETIPMDDRSLALRAWEQFWERHTRSND